MPIEIQRSVLEKDAGVDGSDGEDEIDPKAHAKLVEGINSLTGSHFIGDVTRTEPSLKRSEFGLSKSKDDKVFLGDLSKFFTKTKKHTAVVKQLDKLKRRRPLVKPLEKPVADRLERKAGYARVKNDLDQWAPVVAATKVAPQIVFPVRYGGTVMHNETPKNLSEYRVKTKLMKEMEELDQAYSKPENIDGDDTDDEEGQNYDLTIEEMREQQRERARQKIRESYEVLKMRRLSKIKSKKFHRLLKKDKLKEQMKKFEELKEKDPEEALRQLDQIEKQRYQERISLRHKNTGTWAKNLQVRAQYDTEVRRELAEQLAIGRELTAKRLQQGESSSESDGEPEPSSTANGANPWTVSKGDYERAVDEQKKLTSGYRKYWEERNKVESMKEQLKKIHAKDSNGDVEKALDAENSDDPEVVEEEIQHVPPKKVKPRRKRKKETVVMASGSWDVEDVDPEEATTGKGVVLKPKANKKRKENIPSVEEMFQEAEELIQDVLDSKLDRVQEMVHNETPDEPKGDEEPSKKRKEVSGDLSFKQRPRLADADEQMDETLQADAEEPSANVFPKNAFDDGPKSDGKPPTLSGSSKTAAEINLNKVVQMKPKHLLTALPDTVFSGEFSEDEADGTQRLTIAEAFEDDDIVADFAKEKHDERAKDIPQEVEQSLPGWGHWAGAGIKPRKPRQTGRKLFKAPPVLTRRDDNRDQVIINEDALKNDKLSKHLVNELPFPFVTVKDYEASLRAPLGRTFIPEMAHAAMIEPRVVTKQGTLIEPMKKELLMKNVSSLRKVGRKQQNRAVDEYNEFVDKEQSKTQRTRQMEKEQDGA